METKQKPNSIEEYLNNLPESRKIKIKKLLNIINQNLPEGFENIISYGMPGWVVPKSIYPAGYHCTPALPLPFLSIASQKNFVALYHMGIYAKRELLDWFVEEYLKIYNKKPDMGKSCIRFKDKDEIPFNLIGELAKKMSPQDWINTYEMAFKK